MSATLVEVTRAGEITRPGQKTFGEWVEYVREPLARMGLAAIETGRRLLDAEAALEKEAALAGTPGEARVMELYKELGIHSSTGARFKAIAVNPNILNFAHVQTLPAAWGTLYELARLTDVQWEYGITSGLINPQMERKDVAKIRAFERRANSPARLGGSERAAVRLWKAEAVDFLRTLAGSSVDLLITDPPYMTDLPEGTSIRAFARSWVPWALSKVKPTGHAFIFTGAYPVELHAYVDAFSYQEEEEPDWKLNIGNLLSWSYRNTLGAKPDRKYILNWQACFHLHGDDAPAIDAGSMLERLCAQEVNSPDARTGIRYHAWQKPDLLAERLIRHTTKPLDLVLDPFAGTGTFLAAAARLGRNAIGCDRDPAMLEICRERGLELADAA